MNKLKAIICLFVFLLSTVGANASVHSCNGEVTEISFLTKASCEHEEVSKEDAHCKMKCCHSDSDNDEQSDNDCCDTEDLVNVPDFSVKASFEIIQLIVMLLPDFNFFVEDQKEEHEDSYTFQCPEVSRDILVDIQCFRI